jgi:hypothetical protein
VGVLMTGVGRCAWARPVNAAARDSAASSPTTASVTLLKRKTGDLPG